MRPSCFNYNFIMSIEQAYYTGFMKAAATAGIPFEISQTLYKQAGAGKSFVDQPDPIVGQAKNLANLNRTGQLNMPAMKSRMQGVAQNIRTMSEPIKGIKGGAGILAGIANGVGAKGYVNNSAADQFYAPVAKNPNTWPMDAIDPKNNDKAMEGLNILRDPRNAGFSNMVWNATSNPILNNQQANNQRIE